MILTCEVETVAKAYSGDLRRRVIDAVEAGASRHEAAEDHAASEQIGPAERCCIGR
jgi:hypothetical protein